MKSAEIAELINNFVQDVGTILSCPPPEGNPWWTQHQKRWFAMGMLDLSTVIDAIAVFPIIPEGLEYPEEDAAHRVIQNTKNFYQDFSKWLRHNLLWQEIPGIEIAAKTAMEQGTPLDSTNYRLVHLFPPAFEAFSQYRLAQGVHLKSSLLRELFPSALSLWASALCSSSKRDLLWSGITGDPVVWGKTEFREYKISALRKYKNLEVCSGNKHDLPAWIQKLHRSELIDQLLIFEAQDVSKVDSKFDMQYFQPFLEAAQKTNALRDPARQMLARRPNGTLIVTGTKNCKLPTDCKPEGFTPRRSKSRRYLTKINKNR